MLENDRLAVLAEESPHSKFLETTQHTWTYLECYQITEQLGNTLEMFFSKINFNLSKKKQLKIAIIVDRVVTVFLLLAIYRRGHIAVPMNHQKTEFQLEEELLEVDADCLIYSKKILALTSLDILLAKINITKLEVKSLVGDDFLKNKLQSLPKSESLVSKRVKRKFIDLNQISTYFFTSGSSGRAKIAAFNLENHFSTAKASNEMILFGTNDLWLVNLPLYHVSGHSILFRALLGGGAIFLAGEEEKDIYQLVCQYKVSHLSLVPSQLIEMIEEFSDNKLKDFFHFIKYLLLGGSPIPERLWKLVEHYPIFPTYGMTESNAQIATYASGNKAGELTLLPNRKVRIAEHEILIQQDSLFEGYLRNGEIEKPFNEGWFHTNDLGKIRVDSNQTLLRIIGRKNSMFVSGGENVYPEEIEQKLMSIPHIIEARVVPFADDKWGEVPWAIIFCDKKFVLTISELKYQLALVLEKYKLPQRIIFSEQGGLIKKTKTDLMKFIKKLI